LLLEAGDRVLPKEELSQQVLGRPLGPYDRSIDVHVSNLRQKLAGCHAGVRLEAVRGVGYRIVATR
jgi:DNA-binding response OmpR family regulator